MFNRSDLNSSLDVGLAYYFDKPARPVPMQDTPAAPKVTAPPAPPPPARICAGALLRAQPHRA